MIDKEWLDLIEEAKSMGLSAEDVRKILILLKYQEETGE